MLGRMLLALAGLVCGVLAARVAAGASAFSFAAGSPGRFMLMVVAGLAPIAVGLVMGRRAAGFGNLLVLTGALWYAAELANPEAGADIAFTLGLVGYVACVPALGHAVLEYQRVRLTWPVQAVVAAGYLSGVAGLGLLTTAFYDPRSSGCGGCPANLLLVYDDPKVATAVATWSIWVLFVWSLAVVALLAGSLVAGRRFLRQLLAPVLLPSLGFLLAVATRLGTSLDRPFLGQTSVDRQLWVVQAWCLVAVAAGVVWTLLRASRTRRGLAR